MEENQGENGGKGTRKFWNSGEIAAAALSFLQVSEDPIVGVNQSGGRFNARLVEAFLERCPENYEGGTWKDRTPQTIYEYIARMKAECVRFNGAILRVDATKPSGVSEMEIWNMAFALFKGKTKKVGDYEFRDFHVEQRWNFYPAWKILRERSYFGSAAARNVSAGGSVSDMKTKSNNRPKGTKKAKLVQNLERRHEYRANRAKHRERSAETSRQMMTGLATMNAMFAFKEKRKMRKSRLRNLQYKLKHSAPTKEERDNLLSKIFQEQELLDQMHPPEVGAPSTLPNVVNASMSSSGTVSSSLSNLEYI